MTAAHANQRRAGAYRRVTRSAPPVASRAAAVGAPAVAGASGAGVGDRPTPTECRPPGTRGQSAVELIALLPLIAVVALAALTVLASHVADEQAGEAAEAGALAVLEGGVEPKQAAASALPGAVRKRATIEVAGGRVHVRVRPHVVLPIAGLAERLAGDARADAGR